MDGEWQQIEGAKIHFRRIGTGNSAILLLHSAVGSYNDFSLQLGGEFELDTEQFTIVALDLPGFGSSELKRRGPSKAEMSAKRRLANLNEPKTKSALNGAEPTLEYFEHCADISAKLMSNLGHRTYTVCGYSDGARVASLLAIKHQSRVDSLILWGFVPLMDERSCYAIAKTRDTSIWHPEALKFYSQTYGIEKFSELWRTYVDYLISSLESSDRFDIRERMSQIKCPTLILHGKEDPIVSYEHHIKPLDMRIFNLDVKQFSGLAHNVHQADPGQFNRVVSNFVVSSRA